MKLLLWRLPEQGQGQALAAGSVAGSVPAERTTHHSARDSLVPRPQALLVLASATALFAIV